MYTTMYSSYPGFGDEIPDVPEKRIDQYNEDLECECPNAGKGCPHTFKNLSEEEQAKLIQDWYESDCEDDFGRY